MATVEAYTRLGADAAIREAVAAVELTPGPAGPQGEAGPAGPQGPAGEPGRDGMTVLTLAAGEEVPEGTPAGTLIVRVIA